MQSLSQIRQRLDERGLRPKRKLGQNFLHDKNQLAKLVAAAGVTPGALVLEVGPGTGTLTEALLESGADVVVSEIDDDMADIVADHLGDRVTIVRGDCLERQRRVSRAIMEALGDRDFTMVANLPYQIASPLMVALLLDVPRCRGQFVTIQKEVGDRLLAAPGTKAYGPLGIIVQTFARVQRLATVPPSCFWPPPKVTSAMLAIEPRDAGDIDVDDRHAFARFVTDVFSKRRKQLGTIFGRQRTWPEGVTEDLRPEVLDPPTLNTLWCATRTDP